MREEKREELLEKARNVPGQFWVEQDICLAHGCCEHEAPQNFLMGDDFVARVFKQPENPEQERQCRVAMDSCPIAAIHDDGETNPEAGKYVGP